MKALRVGTEFYINADDIEVIQAWPTRPAAREKGAAQEAGRYYDATGGRKILSVVTLKNGWVIATPFTPTRLVQRPTIAAPSKASVKFADRDKAGSAAVQAIEILNAAPGGDAEEEFEDSSREFSASPKVETERALVSSPRKRRLFSRAAS